MSEQETNKQLIRELIEAANAGNMERVAAAYSGSYRDHTLGGSRGAGHKEATMKAFRELQRAFPDTQHVVDDLIAEGDKVVLRMHAAGRHEHPFRGIETTGREVRMQTTTIYRLARGLIEDRWCDGASAVADHLADHADPVPKDQSSEPTASVRLLRGAAEPWRDDVPGSRFQEIGLESVSLTCFRLEPHTAFEAHSHRSEQITYVLEGELVFLVDHEEHVIFAGEAIAVPARVTHAVRAGPAAVLAIDAWSPPQGHLGT